MLDVCGQGRDSRVGFPRLNHLFSRETAVKTDGDIPTCICTPALHFATLRSLAATVLVYGRLRKQLFAHFRIALQCVKSLPSDCALVGNRLASDSK
ncbi:MAG: hypothetical protein MJ033_03075 [Victivallaceae bacterium]|nr:hypothetical protein [Victivallaceae bacterium]